MSGSSLSWPILSEEPVPFERSSGDIHHDQDLSQSLPEPDSEPLAKQWDESQWAVEILKQYSPHYPSV